MFCYKAFVIKRNEELHCFVFHFPDISSNMNLSTNISWPELLVNVITFLALYSCIPFIFVSEYNSILREFGGFSKCYELSLSLNEMRKRLKCRIPCHLFESH